MGSIWEVLYRNQGRLFELFWAMTLVSLIASQVFRLEMLAGLASVPTIFALIAWPVSAAMLFENPTNKVWVFLSILPIAFLALLLPAYIASLITLAPELSLSLSEHFFLFTMMSYFLVCLLVAFRVARNTRYSFLVTFFCLIQWIFTRDIPRIRIDEKLSSLGGKRTARKFN